MKNTRLIETQLGQHRLFIEAVVPPGTEPTSSADNASARVLAAFDAAKDVAIALADRVGDSLDAFTNRAGSPDEVAVEFGLTLTTTGSVIFASSSAEASLVITLTYDRHSKS